jgi:hypothetical protein
MTHNVRTMSGALGRQSDSWSPAHDFVRVHPITTESSFLGDLREARAWVRSSLPISVHRR